MDSKAAPLLFRHKVFWFRPNDGLLRDECTRLLLSWWHSGFSVHTSGAVAPDGRAELERLARDLRRPPVSRDRLKVDEHAPAIAYAARVRPGHDRRMAATPLDAKAFLARVIMHIPDPRRHVIRSYGA